MYNNEKLNYYISPEEIADALINQTPEACRDTQRGDLVRALEWLEAAAENPYNSNGFRVLMDVLTEITDSLNIPLF